VPVCQGSISAPVCPELAVVSW